MTWLGLAILAAGILEHLWWDRREQKRLREWLETRKRGRS